MPGVPQRRRVPEAITGAMEKLFEFQKVGDGRFGIPEDRERTGNDEIDVAARHREVLDELKYARAEVGHSDVELAAIEVVARASNEAERLERSRHATHGGRGD